MGLDTFASRAPGRLELSEEDERAFDEAGIELCGGIYSGDGGSFRGKVYIYTVLRVTGVSLYEKWVPPETVRLMADAFERCDPEAVERDVAGKPYQTSAREIRELRRFFRICADRGLGLIAWW